MNRYHLGVAAIVAILILAPRAGAQPAPTVLPVDRPVTVEGIEVACTGIGLAVREDSRWRAFPVRIEFANAAAEYLADATVTISRRGAGPLLSVSCDAPWLLVKLLPGAYVASARLNWSAAPPRSAAITAPTSGQARYVLSFDEP